MKWLNVFQEASFSLDRATGRCLGSVTWTDKLIQSMDSGFFRLLDAGRYMELDGITAKHLYRFLAVAFEKTDMILMDARKLAVEHLGILNPPKYLSRLMQTLEPAFDQLIRIEVLGSYHIVEAERWEIALRRHHNYVPERKMLLSPDPVGTRELNQFYCMKRLERASMPEKLAQKYAEAAATKAEFYQLERAARLLENFAEHGVVAHVALSLIRKTLDAGPLTEEGLRTLDIYEIALDMCRQKKAAGQNMRNPAGLIVKIIKDPDAVLGDEVIDSACRAFRQQEQAIFAQQELAEQRALVLEYEQYRDETAQTLFEELPDSLRTNLRREKNDLFRQQARYDKLDAKAREQEVDDLIRHDLARREVPPFEKWYIRRRAQQTVLPFGPPGASKAISSYV